MRPSVALNMLPNSNIQRIGLEMVPKDAEYQDILFARCRACGDKWFSSYSSLKLASQWRSLFSVDFSRVRANQASERNETATILFIFTRCSRFTQNLCRYLNGFMRNQLECGRLEQAVAARIKGLFERRRGTTAIPRCRHGTPSDLPS